MNNRQFNLPAGQNAGTGVGMAMPVGGDMVVSSSHGHMGGNTGGGGGGGGGPRRRGGGYGGGPGHGNNNNYGQQHHYLQHQHHMYNNYVYPNTQYYQPMPQMAGYQNMGMQNAHYMQYNQYSRTSPPAMQQYVSMMGVGAPGYNTRQSQPSPALATPYQPPALPVPMTHHTPTLTPSLSQVQAAPAQPVSPGISQQVPMQPLVVSSETANLAHSSASITASNATMAAMPLPAVVPAPSSTDISLDSAVFEPAAAALSPAVTTAHVSPSPAQSSSNISRVEADLVSRQAFRPPLPWLSMPHLPFPQRAPRKKKRALQVSQVGTTPESQTGQQSQQSEPEEAPQSNSAANVEATIDTPQSIPAKPASPVPASLASDTTSSYAVPTPSSSQEENLVAQQNISKPVARPPIPTVPAVPVIPAIPKASPKEARPHVTNQQTPSHPTDAGPDPSPEALVPPTAVDAAETPDKTTPLPSLAPAPPPAKLGNKPWATLFNRPAQAQAGSGLAADETARAPNGVVTADGSAGLNNAVSGKGPAHGVAEALRSYQVTTPEKVAFIQPRGLINTGNMCYMNSVLQVLIFCTPFYEFLDQINKKAAHSFKSETPLIDAMVLFLREFKIIDSAASVEQLRRRVKAEELETFGEPFTPEFVYDVIRRLPRFADMRRGHQQDAEEFLGFLLQSLDDECSHVMGLSPATAAASVPEPGASDTGSDWQEVGHRQRAAVTRSSGQNSTSPISKIFGGFLRSELRIAGLKDSITNEPYQPLQLDIGSPKVHNIVDALRNLTTQETISGNFNPERGANIPAVKQVFIETLPPVLILHLKRFQFDAHGNGTVKLWKKVGYPLDLEVPREVFSRQKRNSLLADPAGIPQYRLNAVVYHHGKSASGGHYTADVRRQDGREWMRLDDTSFKRISSADVAAAGAEETAKGSRATSPANQPNNRFGAINDEDAGDDDGWKQVNSAVNGGKRWSSVVNDAQPTTTKSKQAKDSIRDNKVAYILFYQRV
jgi:ubiquitin carboxyl-terminal hydrolase 10